MTPGSALYSFFSSFGLTAYKHTGVPDGAQYPYLTYEDTGGYFGDGAVNCTVNLWYYTDSEATPNAKVEQIANAIGRGGKQLTFDGGLIWVRRGTPFCQSLTDASDHTVKRRYINLELEYMR